MKQMVGDRMMRAQLEAAEAAHADLEKSLFAL